MMHTCEHGLSLSLCEKGTDTKSYLSSERFFHRYKDDNKNEKSSGIDSFEFSQIKSCLIMFD